MAWKLRYTETERGIVTIVVITIDRRDTIVNLRRQPPLRGRTGCATGRLKQWRHGTTVFRELRKLGASADLAARIAGNARSWWRNSRMGLNKVSAGLAEHGCSRWHRRHHAC